MLAMQPIRHGLFKRFFNKFKYQKKKRERLLAVIEESEALPREVLRDEFVSFMQALPEIPEFLAQMEARDKLEAAQIKELPEDGEQQVEESG